MTSDPNPDDDGAPPPQLAVGDAVIWETPWSKPIAALVIELDGDRARVILRRKREVVDSWTPIERLARSAEINAQHRRLAEEIERFLQRDLF